MKKISILTIIALTFWSCSTFNQNYKLGTEAALNKNWDAAIKYYERGVQEKPNNSFYRLALFRAKISASYAHLHEARRLASQGKKEEALMAYEKVLSYGSLNKAIAQEARSFIKGETEEDKQKIAIELPEKLKVSEEKIQLKTVTVSLRSKDWTSLQDLNINYIGYIVSCEKIVALIIIDGNALAVEKGEIINEGAKVVEITPEEIEIMGPDSEKRKYSLEREKEEK